MGLLLLNSSRGIPTVALEKNGRRANLYKVRELAIEKMAEIARFSGARPITPPSDVDDRCPGTEGAKKEVNNPDNDSTPSYFPPSPANSIRVRRNRSSSQREAIRSKQFTNRQQRSDSNPIDDLLGRRKLRGFRQKTSSLPADHGLKAIEPPHEQVLTKMAFAEQQKWITVQQKTFTKWYGLQSECSRTTLTVEQVEHQNRTKGIGRCGFGKRP
jgi:hypothetical protein